MPPTDLQMEMSLIIIILPGYNRVPIYSYYSGTDGKAVERLLFYIRISLVEPSF